MDQGKIGESHWAAQAAECANQQAKFWEYHDVLFTRWTGENVGTYTKPKLKQYAADLKLDTTAFNQCLDSDATLSIVQADTAAGTQLGVRYTPIFFINNRQVSVQSLDFSSFARAIDAAIK